MFLIEPKSEAAREWIEENVITEGWQWLGRNLAVDHHYIETLVEGLESAGFTEDDFSIIYA